MEAYEAPAITVLGSVSDFTQSKGSGSWDGIGSSSRPAPVGPPAESSSTGGGAQSLNWAPSSRSEGGAGATPVAPPACSGPTTSGTRRGPGSPPTARPSCGPRGILSARGMPKRLGQLERHLVEVAAVVGLPEREVERTRPGTAQDDPSVVDSTAARVVMRSTMSLTPTSARNSAAAARSASVATRLIVTRSSNDERIR